MITAPKGRNLAGIIPLSGWENNFNFPWPDYLQPIAEDFLAIERSVLECAYAGCDSIWVVCNDDFAPLVRKRIGDYLLSPRFLEEKRYVKRKDYHEKWIPIYYTPVSTSDRDRRDSLGWSVLHGALTAFQVSDKMSKWVCPTKYFVSFPYGLYNIRDVSNYRSSIRGPNRFSFSYGNQTVREGLYLGFTFLPSDWPKIKWNIKNQCTRGDKSIPAHLRWSSKNLALEKIFNHEVLPSEEIIEVEQYHSLNSWSELKDFYMSSGDLAISKKQIMKPYIY